MADLTDNVSEEERIKIHKLCQQYLSGIWSESDEKSLTIRRFAQGFVNKIFYCKLNDHINRSDVEECEPVVVKFALPEDFYLYNPLITIINSLILSEKGLAPKALGVFPGGIINQYIKGRSYNYSDDYNASTVQLLARKLAKFHSLKLPVPKDNSKKWLKILFESLLEEPMFESIKNGKLGDTIKNSNYEALKRIDLIEQFLWMRSAILATKPVLVYSHCDFNRGNILVQENDQKLDMVFIDFDYSSYNFRGIDIGRYFSSWRHKDSHFGFGDFPTDEEMSTFIDTYIDESVKINGNSYSNSELNSREYLIREAKLFTLVSYLIDVLFCLWTSDMDESKSDEFLPKGETRCSGYEVLKDKFQKEKSLPEGFN